MKKYIISFFVFLLFLVICSFVYASDSIPDIYVNGTKIDTQNDIMFEDSTVYVEANRMAEIFGAILSCDNADVVYTFSNNVRTVTYDSNNGSVIVSDRNSFLYKIVEDAYPAMINQGKTYIPIRMICYGFYMDVNYDSLTHAISISSIYDGVGIFNSEGTAIASYDKHFALVDSAGNLLSEFIYDKISNYDNDNLFTVCSNGFLGLLNSNGRMISDVTYDDIIYESPSKIYIKKDGLVGMCDINGKVLIQPVYDDIIYCANSIAMVKQDEKWHTLNFATGVLSENYFDEVYRITDGIQSDNDMIEGYYVVRKGKWGCVDSFGNISIDTKYEALDKFDINGRARVIYNGKMGIIDCGGREIIPTAYDHIYPFGRLNSTVAQLGTKYGVLDSNGDIVVPFEYDYIYPYNDAITTVAYKNGKFGLLSNQGKVISDFEYEYMEEFKNGLALTYKNGYGYIDHMGHEIIPAQYEDVKQGTALSMFLKKDGYWQLYSPTGICLGDNKFLTAGEFSNGLSAVSVSSPGGAKYGYVNDSGDVIIPFEYTMAHSFKYGKAIVSKDNYIGIIDVEGNMVIPFSYTGFNPSYDYNVIAAADENSKWGLISFNNEKLCEFEYDYIFEFENGYAPVLKNHKYGLIDLLGNVVVDLKYETKDEVLALITQN